MKHILFVCANIMSIALYSADDGGTYIPLERISVDEHSDEGERTAVTIKTIFDYGVRSVNQTLNISKRGLTSVHDLPRYRRTLDLANLTTLNASKNQLGSDDLGTILRTLVQLKTLNMGFNNVISLATIPSHQHLETLLLNDNKINALNVADFFGKLSRLRQCAFHNNKLAGKTITGRGGSYPSVEEFWFGNENLAVKCTNLLVQEFPNITSEFGAGSNLVQKHYSKVEAKWDNCRECPNCDDCLFVYVFPSVVGGVVGIPTAALVPLLSFGLNCAIFVPVGVVLTPLTIRIGKMIYNYCRTKPENRYITIPTRHIAAEPSLLDLIEDDVETVPDQEQVQEQEEDAV